MPTAYGFATTESICCRVGRTHFAHLLNVLPDRYAEHEAAEQSLRDYLGKDVSILRDRAGGDTAPLTLRALREQIEAGGVQDEFEWGGCGCFAD